jgi:hypothetical protein
LHETVSTPRALLAERPVPLCEVQARAIQAPEVETREVPQISVERSGFGSRGPRRRVQHHEQSLRCGFFGLQGALNRTG